MKMKLKIKDNTLSTWENNLNNALDAVDIGIWDYDVIEDEAFWSSKTYAIYGLEQDVVPNFQSVLDLIHPDDKEDYLNKYNDAIKERKSFQAKYRIYRKDHSVRIINTYADVLLDENKQVVRVVGTTVDITTQDYFNQQLLKRINNIAKNLDVGIWTMNAINNKLTFISGGIESICGYSPKEFKDNQISWVNLIYKEDLKEYEIQQEKLRLNQKVKHQYRIIHKNGEIKWIQDETIPVFDMNGILFRIDGIVSDISEQKVLEEKMTYLAHHDSLTDLPNRLMFENELNNVFETISPTNEQIAVMCLDLDGFKKINDTFGHLTGDKLLKEASSRLKQCFCSHDLIARTGGDEFSAIVRHITDVQDLIYIAEMIITLLEEPFFIDDYELFISTSIGIAILHGTYDAPSILLKHGDIALYHAKHSGKNTYKFFSSSMENEYLKFYHIERDLRKAIKNNELLLHYQPKVDADTKKIVGAEALIRWNHFEKGLISPSEFIPVAEECGLIIDITDWTFRTVCKQLKEWEIMNERIVPISVNISPKRFVKIDWFETFVQIIQETDVNPELLELEITETAIIDNDLTFIESIKKLKKLGIKISLDDFGTGYSSLIYLKKFMIDTVKIDQYFIKTYLTENNAPIAKYTINLAHELNLNVVAEGVETENQLDFLRKYNCNQIQGYLFSKPVPIEEFKILLKKSYL